MLSKEHTLQEMFECAQERQPESSDTGTRASPVSLSEEKSQRSCSAARQLRRRPSARPRSRHAESDLPGEQDSCTVDEVTRTLSERPRQGQGHVEAGGAFAQGGGGVLASTAGPV